MSGAAGLALRKWVSRTVRRILLALGGGSFAAALGVMGIMVLSHGRLIGMWTAGMLAVVFLGVAALILPFALAASWGDRTTQRNLSE